MQTSNQDKLAKQNFASTSPNYRRFYFNKTSNLTRTPMCCNLSCQSFLQPLVQSDLRSALYPYFNLSCNLIYPFFDLFWQTNDVSMNATDSDAEICEQFSNTINYPVIVRLQTIELLWLTQLI